jgi:hypothetical protein
VDKEDGISACCDCRPGGREPVGSLNKKNCKRKGLGCITGVRWCQCEPLYLDNYGGIGIGGAANFRVPSAKQGIHFLVPHKEAKARKPYLGETAANDKYIHDFA